ncbi:Rz lytic protein [Erwiniaceae bacterium BAC15a-03b]|uniref:Rz lytic protein n=1 Tax=Winslowiella arboricola TaxID=2978220 RepID=A0A9J6PYA4_9GAMM|nr:Rz lytic protein [Winslowiella arboricola]MCU5775106.1 Rz lytic protein [Winslowiella arboricola]MCU5780440.1 Rz lytic protein [Winslowiella arboricola]
MIPFIKNYSHIIVIGLICVALWGLNARNSQLTATNDRLEKLANSKDDQINDLRSKNDGLAASVTGLVSAVRQQNDVMSQVTDQRVVTAQQNRKLQNEIKRYLEADKCATAPVPADAADRLRAAAKAAGGISDNKATSVEATGRADKPD